MNKYDQEGLFFTETEEKFGDTHIYHTIADSKNWERNFKVKLDVNQLKQIENKVQKSQKEILISLQKPIKQVKGVYFSIIVSLLVILFSVTINNVGYIADISSVAKGKYETVLFGLGLSYANISKLEDLDDYIRSVYLPNTFSINDMSFTEYIVGSRFTLKMYKLTKNPLSDYNQEVPFYVSGDDYLNGVNGEQVQTINIGIWPYSQSGGYGGQGGYVVYFINQTLEDVLDQWRTMKPLWLADNFALLAIETIIHCRNLETTVLYTQLFKKLPSGQMLVSSQANGIFIEMYENQSKTHFVVVVLLLSFYGLAVIIQSYKLILNIIRIIKTFLESLKVDIDWFEYIEFLNVAMASTTILMFCIIILGNIGKYKLPIVNTNDFDGMINYFREFKTLSRINGISCLLIMIKLTIVLRYKFPSFGVLYTTIGKAKNDMINFSFLVFIMLLGFVFMGLLAFGPSHDMFSTIQGSFNALLVMILSKVAYSSLYGSNSSKASIFMISYYILFFCVLLNMFISIVLSTFLNLKNQSQILLETRSEMVKRKTKKFIKQIVNLFTFKIKNTLIEDSTEYLRLTNIDNYEKIHEIKQRTHVLSKSILTQYNKDYYAVFKYNLGKVLSRLKTGLVKSNEKLKIEIQDTLRKIFIKNKKKEIKKNLLSNNKYYNYAIMKQVLIFLIFFSFTLAVVICRNNIKSSYSFNTIIKNVLGMDKVDDITTEDDVYNYMAIQMLPFFRSMNKYPLNCILREPMIRLTFNRYQVLQNTNSFSDSAIKEYIDSGISQNDFRGEETQILYKYQLPGRINGQGGFLIDLFSDEDFSDLISLISNDRLFSKKTQSMAFEWVVYNPNVDVFVYCRLRFVNNLGGHIDTDLQTTYINLNLFSTSEAYLGAFEVIIACFVMYFIYKEALLWNNLMAKSRQNLEKAWRGERTVHEAVGQIIRKKDIKGCKGVLMHTWRYFTICLKYCGSLLKIVLQTTFKYLSKSIFTIITVSIIGLTISLLSQIMLIYKTDLVHSYKLVYESENFIYEFYKMSLIFNRYRQISGLLVFCCGLKMIEYLQLSQPIGFFAEVLHMAQFDLIFFLMMFFTVLFGYALMGYLILGHSLSNFESIESSIMSCFLMLKGSLNLKDFVDADDILGSFYFGSFIVIFYLLLLNMFIAILCAHYKKTSKQDFSKLPFFLVRMWRILKSVWFGIDEFNISREEGFYDPYIYDEKFEDQADQHNEMLNLSLPLLTPKENPEAWYKALLEVAKTKSAGKLFLDKMNNRKHKREALSIASIQEVVFISPMLWESLNIQEKSKYWRTLSSLQQLNYHYEIEKAILMQESIPPVHLVSESQFKLWHATDIKEKIELWVGKHHFNDYERVCIWNTITFSQKIFGKAQENWTVDDENNHWKSLSFSEKLKISEKILAKLKRLKKDFQKSKNKLEKLKEDKFLKLDFKELLWMCLSIDDSLKLSLYISNYDTIQSNLIAFLILAELTQSVFSIEKADVYLEESLDFGYYKEIFEKCYYLAETQRSVFISESIENSKNEIRNLKDYKIKLKEDLMILKMRKTKLVREFIRN